MLVTNPIPDEYAMDLDYINRNIDAAIAEAKSLGIHGKDTTPFLLDKIQKLTGGDSLKANIQLVYNNAPTSRQWPSGKFCYLVYALFLPARSEKPTVYIYGLTTAGRKIRSGEKITYRKPPIRWYYSSSSSSSASKSA